MVNQLARVALMRSPLANKIPQKGVVAAPPSAATRVEATQLETIATVKTRTGKRITTRLETEAKATTTHRGDHSSSSAKQTRKISGTTRASTRSRTSRTRSQTARSASTTPKKPAKVSMANLAPKAGTQVTEEEEKADMEAHRALQSTLRIIHNSNNTIQGATTSTRKMTMSLFKSFSSTTISNPSSSANRQVKHLHLISSCLWAACLIRGRLRDSLRRQLATNYPKSIALTTNSRTSRRKAKAASVSQTPVKRANSHSQASRPQPARTIISRSRGDSTTTATNRNLENTIKEEAIITTITQVMMVRFCQTMTNPSCTELVRISRTLVSITLAGVVMARMIRSSSSIRRRVIIITTIISIRHREEAKVVRESQHLTTIKQMSPRPSSRCLRTSRLSGTTWANR